MHLLEGSEEEEEVTPIVVASVINSGERGRWQLVYQNIKVIAIFANTAAPII